MQLGNLVGKSLAGCRLTGFIGSGSSGEVFKGVHEALRRPVAVKIVRIETEAQEAADRLLAEARSLAKIEHPHIVHVYDVGIQDGLFYQVMQFLEGTTLKSRFDEAGALSVEEVYDVVGNIARGLGAMHEQGLVHRDLKLENVILTPEGRAIITDFGLVRDSGSKDEFQGRIVGSPPYIPPEIWLGRPADPRSDLYSLGVILYALLTGAYPFRAKTHQEYRELHLGKAPRNPAEARSGVSEELAAVTLKLMARSRDARYESVQEFLSEFEGCRRGIAPEALKSAGSKVKCGFCESIMPAKAAKCSVCGEGLQGPREIGFKSPAGERACPACGGMRERRARSCPHCGTGICGNCLRRIVAKDGLCADCLAIE